jgi:hypothetical protein
MYDIQHSCGQMLDNWDCRDRRAQKEGRGQVAKTG